MTSAKMPLAAPGKAVYFFAFLYSIVFAIIFVSFLYVIVFVSFLFVIVFVSFLFVIVFVSFVFVSAQLWTLTKGRNLVWIYTQLVLAMVSASQLH